MWHSGRGIKDAMFGGIWMPAFKVRHSEFGIQDAVFGMRCWKCYVLAALGAWHAGCGMRDAVLGGVWFVVL
jgi:hypothetical protein